MSDENLASSEGEQQSDHLGDTSPTPTPEATGSAIPLPPVNATDPVTPTSGTPVPPVAAPVTAEQPNLPMTPPGGTPVPAAGAVGGSYALGAFAGNPNLGASSGPGYYSPPTNPIPPQWAPPTSPNPSQPASGSHRFRNVVAVTGAIVLAVVAGAGISHAAWKSNTPTVSAAPASNTTPPSSGSSGSSGSPFGSGNSGSSGNSSNSGSSNSSGPSDVSSIAAKVDPGLVDISTTLGYQSEEAAGTGIVLTSSGEILTNNHVIDGATTISVTDVGNGKTYSASVVGYDRTSDVAVLQLHNASGLQTASLTNSSDVSVGEDVVGIGNAGGTGGTPSAAGGTVTALNQAITASDEGDGSSEQLTGLIETNADIQAGDSGGSLVNTSGQVVGIDTAASAGFSFQGSSSSSGNQGYAIPINTAISLAQKIEASDATSTIHIGATAFLGVSIQSTSASSGSGSGTGGGFGGEGGGFGGGLGNGGGGSGSGSGSGSGQSASGVSIAQVVTSSPAQEAGLAEGDVITTVNGKTITSPTDLTNLLEPDHPGDKITLGWTDTSGDTHTASVQLSSGPPQ
jgi:S1-C subfamily serine protease